MKIEVQIRECINGYIVEDSFFGEEKYVTKWEEAVIEATNRFKKYAEEQAAYEKERQESEEDEKINN